MFKDTDAPIGQTPVIDPAYRQVGEIRDPELARICTDLAEKASGISEGLAELAASTVVERDPATVSPQHIDALVQDIAGDKSTRVVQASKALAPLQKYTGDPEDPNENVLSDITATFVFGTARRQLVRGIHGATATKARHLIDFWEKDNVTLSDEQLKQINRAVADPIQRFLDQDKDLSQHEPESLIEHSVRRLQIRGQIDPSTDLSTLKFLVFSSIVECFKNPLVQDAYHSIYDKGTEPREKHENSPNSPYYRAAEFLGHLDAKSPKEYRAELRFIHQSHVKGRFLKVPSRGFKELHKRLTELSRMYRDLQWTERVIEQIAPLNMTSRGIIGKEAKKQTDTLAARAIVALQDTLDATIARHNVRMEGAADDPAREEIWLDSDRAEKVITGVASSLLGQIDEQGFGVDPNYKEALTIFGQTQVKAFHDAATKAREQARLRPEIEKRLSAFLGIDTQYSLSNKQLRTRQPGIATLARQLSEALNGNDPLDDTTARSLVGLMLGVYWERTGQGTPPEQYAAKYLEDAAELRVLSGELTELGFPVQSQLLKLTNLLDEMVDSGFFDKHPELEQFEDFVVAYMLAQGGEPEREAIEEPAIPPTDTPDDEPEPLPIEAMRSATYEDIEVFPPGTSADDIIEDYRKRIGKDDLPLIEWERIKRLVDMRDHCHKQGLETEFVRTKHASWQTLPFFVLAIRLPKDPQNVAVVESPVYGNATYIYREADNRLPWRDVVQLERKDARDLGAVPAVHVNSERLDKHFQKLWDRVISELTVLR